jgi:hypothetical protein
MKFKTLAMLSLSILSFSTAVMASDVKLPESVLKAHIIACPEFIGERAEFLTIEEFKLPQSEYSSTTNTLYVVGCEMYAYNSMGMAYIYNKTYGSLEQVAVAEVLAEGDISATTRLMGVGYDEATQTLGTFQKGRGVGDCGSSFSYKYNSRLEKFVLTEARVKESCDGEFDAEWPIVYKK